MSLPYIIKVAISEQRIVDAIGKRVDRIAALPADQQGDLALKTKYQLRGMGGERPVFIDEPVKMNGLRRRVSPDTYNKIYPGYFWDSDVPKFITIPAEIERLKREKEIATNLVSGKYQEAGKIKDRLDQIQNRNTNYGYGNHFEKHKNVDGWRNNLADYTRDHGSLRDLYGNAEISPETAKAYKKSIGTSDSKITDAAEAAAPQAMKFMKRYRVPLAIGAGLGLAGLGAGIYAHNKNKEQ